METAVSGSTLVTPLAFIATHFLIKRYHLSASLYFSVQTLMVACFQVLVNPAARAYLWHSVPTATHWIKTHPWALVCVLVVYVLPHGVGLFRSAWQRYKGDTMTKVFLYRGDDMDTLYEYMEQNSTIFALETKNIHCGVPDLLDIRSEKTSNNVCSLRGQRWFDDPLGLAYKDTHFNVEGTLTFIQRDIMIGNRGNNDNNEEEEAAAPQKCKAFYMALEVTHGPLTAWAYFKKIETWLEESAHIKRFSYKIMRQQDNNISWAQLVMYKGKRESFDTKCRQFYDSFFHNKKVSLLRRINVMQREHWHRFTDRGQSPAMNLLLHGPPGTGKSTFAYRVARLLDRHVVSIDLRSIDDKYELYNMLHEGRFSGVCRKPRDCVFVFEEFDIAVKYLHEKEKARQQMLTSELWSLAAYRHRRGYDKRDDEDGDTKKGKKDKASSSSFFASSFTHNEFHLKDLLELLQGPVPNEGQIIIATTNHYDDIQALCPALFRPGRLTSIHFGHFNRATFVDLVTYYFGEQRNVPQLREPLALSPAKLIEMALHSLEVHPDDAERAFHHFCRKVK